jgi:hypothetical protein
LIFGVDKRNLDDILLQRNGEASMKRYSIIVLAFAAVLIACPSLGEEITFLDVPQDHWAKDAVYDLVKKGVTQGYPDGTFRGTKSITRYETAMFLSKLAAIVDTSSQVDVSALKADIAALKEEIEELKTAPPTEPQGIPVTGDFKARYRVANVITSGTSPETAAARKGPRVDYRLKMTLSKDLGDGAGVKVNLDTMDAGWNGGREDLATKLLDVEGKLLVHAWDLPISIKMTAGPGPVTYTPTVDATLPSEVGTVYMRPRNSIFAQAFIGALDLEAGYTARTLSPTGEVDVSQITAKIGYTFVGLPLFEIFKVYFTGDVLARDILRDSSPNDSRGKLSFSGSLNENTTSTLTFGSSQSKSADEGYYIGWETTLADPWGTGTFITLNYHKVGAEYIISDLATAEFDIIGLDLFDKPIVNNIQDWGLDIKQYMNSHLALKAKVDLRLDKNGEYDENNPDCSTTIEGGLSYNIAENTELDLLYKTYNVPSDPSDATTDVLSLIFQYKF